MGLPVSLRMPLGKRQRRWLLALGIILGALLLLCLSLPLWFPWLLPSLAARRGVHFERYERAGYRRFAVYQASFTNRTVRFRAERVEALTPSAWLWRTATGKGAGPWVRVEGWVLETTLAPRPAGEPPSTPSLFTNVQELARSLPAVERWLPAATLSNGTVQIQQTLLELPAATWSRGKIWAKLGFQDQQGTVSMRLGKTLPYELQFQSESLHLQATMQLTTNEDGFLLRSRSLWWSNRVDLQAQFGVEGLLPGQASLQVPNLRIAPQWIGLEDYYRDIHGSMSGTWEQGRFELNLNAAARPRTNQANLPPLQVALLARGDTNGATIETAAVHSSWLNAELSRALKVHFQREFIQEPAGLSIVADLSRQSWFPWHGKVSGGVELTPGAGNVPRAQFNLKVTDTGTAVLTARSGEAEGNFDWPWLEVRRGQATFDDGSQAVIKGRFDVTNRLLSGVSAELRGPLVNRWLPPGCRLENGALQVDISGPLAALSHQGSLRATNFNVPRLHPLQVVAEWQGTNWNFSAARVGVTSRQTVLEAEGAVQVRAGDTTIRADQLAMKRGGSNLFNLAQPVRVVFQPGRAGERPWNLESGLLDWSGEGRRVQVQGSLSWPSLGRGTVVLTNIPSELVAAFFTNQIEKFEVQHLVAEVGWTNGPAGFAIDLHASGLDQSDLPLTAEARLFGGGGEVVITNLAVNSRTSAVTRIEGRLPLTFKPGATNFVGIDFKAPLQLKANIEPRAVVWEKLAGLTGMTLLEPACDANLGGTWAAPTGEVHLRARRLQFRQATAEIPSLEELKLDLELDRERARLTDGRLLVQGQQVTLTGEFPLGENFFNELRAKRPPNWENASAHLQVDNAQVAAFAPLLPQVLSPQGEVDLDLSLMPGGKLDGALKLQHGRTRPLGTLGAIRDIEVEMKFVERTLKLESGRADIGGAAILATGTADLSGTQWLQGIAPPFRFALRGTNVPLSRQPESIIRSDLDLAVIRTNNEPALISGTVKLRDSFYLRDVRDLVPGKVASPNRRPPYFSVETQPLADWRLAARVTGTRFLKVRSTLFNGEISANLKLEGTLREPEVLGDLKVDSGAVRFPFASLAVRQGFVTLSSSDPYRPRLELQAESKKFGYDLKMDASGPVDAPVLQFSSTPPLNSEQIVLMVSAGEVPRGTLVLTPQQKAQTVAVFFGRDLLARLGLGDDSEDRLTFQSGEQVSEQGRPTYNVEYKLTDRWSLVGEYDRFNAFNAGLKWRVYSR